MLVAACNSQFGILILDLSDNASVLYVFVIVLICEAGPIGRNLLDNISHLFEH